MQDTNINTKHIQYFYNCKMLKINMLILQLIEEVLLKNQFPDII